MDESFLALFEFLFDLLRLFLSLLWRLQVFGVLDFIGMILQPNAFGIEGLSGFFFSLSIILACP